MRSPRTWVLPEPAVARTSRRRAGDRRLALFGCQPDEQVARKGGLVHGHYDATGTADVIEGRNHGRSLRYVLRAYGDGNLRRALRPRSGADRLAARLARGGRVRISLPPPVNWRGAASLGRPGPPGFGASTGRRRGAARRYAELVMPALKEIGDGPFVLVGHLLRRNRGVRDRANNPEGGALIGFDRRAAPAQSFVTIIADGLSSTEVAPRSPLVVTHAWSGTSEVRLA